MTSYPKFPLQPGHDGRSATVERDRWIRDLLEAFLFTNPGERINRPEFGSGLIAMVFRGNHAALSDALDANVRASIEQYFSHLLDLEELKIEQHDALLEIEVVYRTRPDNIRHQVRFKQEVSA